MRIQSNVEKVKAIARLLPGDMVRVVYEVEGDWVPIVAEYRGRYSPTASWRSGLKVVVEHDDRLMHLHIAEIVEIEHLCKEGCGEPAVDHGRCVQCAGIA